MYPIPWLSAAWNCGLRMRRECRERFPRHRLQKKLQVSDPGMHSGTCVTHVSWCMSRSLTRGGGKTFPAFPAHAQPAILRIWQEANGINLVHQENSGFVTGRVSLSSNKGSCILCKRPCKNTKQKFNMNYIQHKFTLRTLNSSQSFRSCREIWLLNDCVDLNFAARPQHFMRSGQNTSVRLVSKGHGPVS